MKDSGGKYLLRRAYRRALPDGSAKVVDRTMRHDLREAIRKIYGTHNFKGEVSVVPTKPGAGAPINDQLLRASAARWSTPTARSGYGSPTAACAGLTSSPAATRLWRVE